LITPENVIELMKTTNEFGLFYVGRAPVDVEQRAWVLPTRGAPHGVEILRTKVRKVAENRADAEDT